LVARSKVGKLNSDFLINYVNDVNGISGKKPSSFFLSLVFMDRLTSITFQIKKGFLLSSFLFEAKQHSLNILSGEFLCCKEQTVFKSLCYILSSDDNRQRHFK